MEGSPCHLPGGIQKPEEYFLKALHFLVRYEWMFNFSMVDILSSGILERLPASWWEALSSISLEELGRLPMSYFNPDWPSSLKRFVRTCRALRLPVYDAGLPQPPSGPGPGPGAAAAAGASFRLNTLTRGMSPKKQHEVVHLAAYISQSCARTGIKCIVDLGSGMGYLCEVLHFVYGFRVVGMESNPGLVQRAGLRHESIRRALHSSDSAGVQYVHCDVSANPEPIQRVLRQYCDVEGNAAAFCLVGLHSCGDLTPSAVSLFHAVDQITAFVLVTCCYHRMLVVPGGECAARKTLDVQDANRSNQRLSKMRLLRRWMLEWRSRRRDDVGPVVEEIESLDLPSSPLRDVDGDVACRIDRYREDVLHRDEDDVDVELDRCQMIVLLKKWLAESGPMFEPRPPPEPEHFLNFPLSRELKDLVKCSGEDPRRFGAVEVDGGDDGVQDGHDGGEDGEDRSLCACQMLRRPLLRLASNETAEQWRSRLPEDFRCRSAHLLSRSLYALYTRDSESNNTQGDCDAINIAADGHFHVEGPPSARSAKTLRELRFLSAALDPLRPLLLGLVGLQTAMQPVCEAVILLDRQMALSQMGVPAATIVKVGDPAVTPRCYALVAVKSQRPATECGAPSPSYSKLET